MASQARANFQSRFTVISETPNCSAIPFSSRPAKSLSSVTRAARGSARSSAVTAASMVRGSSYEQVTPAAAKVRLSSGSPPPRRSLRLARVIGQNPP